MMRFFLALLFLSFSTCGNAQSEIDLSAWSQVDLDNANTGKDLKYLSADEKKVVFYMNLVRVNPSLFSKTILPQYVADNEIKSNSYLVSLYADLKKTKPMPALTIDSNLTVLSKDYAISHGKKGQIGHVAFAQRMKDYGYAAENCDYGDADPLDIVMALLIDDGISGVGHRQTMLSSTYKITGISIQPHKVYRTCCVIDYADRSATPTVKPVSKKK